MFYNSCTSPQEWTVGLVPTFLFVRSGPRAHSYQMCYKYGLIIESFSKRLVRRISQTVFWASGNLIKAKLTLLVTAILHFGFIFPHYASALHIPCPLQLIHPTNTSHSLFPFQYVIIVFFSLYLAQIPLWYWCGLMYQTSYLPDLWHFFLIFFSLLSFFL